MKYFNRLVHLICPKLANILFMEMYLVDRRKNIVHGRNKVWTFPPVIRFSMECPYPSNKEYNIHKGI